MLRTGRDWVDMGPARAAASHGGMLHGSFVSARSERGEHRDEMRRYAKNSAHRRAMMAEHNRNYRARKRAAMLAARAAA